MSPVRSGPGVVAALVFGLLATGASAQRVTVTRYLGGTGFFVSRSGQLVTNAHVVENCAAITLRGPFGEAPATIGTVDRKGDLALLKTSYRPIHIAQLRGDEGRLQPGDKVAFLGYPAEEGRAGRAVMTESKIIALYGPRREPDYVQFDDSAQHGNSGGALLDLSGDVVGVVSAKSVTTYKDPYAHHGKAEEKADLAITLPALKRFLKSAGVGYQEEDSQLYASDSRLKTLASGYTTQVLCRQK